jgi:hypothetical protein
LGLYLDSKLTLAFSRQENIESHSNLGISKQFLLLWMPCITHMPNFCKQPCNMIHLIPPSHYPALLFINSHKQAIFLVYSLYGILVQPQTRLRRKRTESFIFSTKFSHPIPSILLFSRMAIDPPLQTKGRAMEAVHPKCRH